jgi:hypothetical protein
MSSKIPCEYNSDSYSLNPAKYSHSKMLISLNKQTNMLCPRSSVRFGTNLEAVTQEIGSTACGGEGVVREAAEER